MCCRGAGICAHRLCWITWTFRKGETALKVAKSGSAAALGLFAFSFLIDLVG